MTWFTAPVIDVAPGTESQWRALAFFHTPSHEPQPPVASDDHVRRRLRGQFVRTQTQAVAS